jgi:aryl-alcohol dehydrogenase-like predicted oxidoreductase
MRTLLLALLPLCIATRARVAMSSTLPSTASAAALADRVPVGTLSVSALGVGALNWPLDKSEDARTAEAVRACAAGGVNFVDTAEAYGFGKSEELVRSSLKTFVAGAEPVVVATKFAPAPWRMTAGSLASRSTRSTSPT